MDMEKTMPYINVRRNSPISELQKHQEKVEFWDYVKSLQIIFKHIPTCSFGAEGGRGVVCI